VDELVREIRDLHRGRGVQNPTLRPGPSLQLALHLEPGTPTDEVRRAVMVAWRRAADAMPPDLSTVLLMVSAITYGNPKVSGRLQHAADLQRLSPRTARRRYDDAVEFLAHSLAAQAGNTTGTDHGFYLLNFDQIADYSEPSPVRIARRTIRVTAPHLDRIVDTIGFPRWDAGEPEYRCLVGCELEETRQLFSGTWEYQLRLPRTLHAGERWEYAVSVRVPTPQCHDPLAAMVATRETHRASVEVWFGENSPVGQVWSLDGVPALAVQDTTPHPPLLAIGEDRRVVCSYENLRPGRAYGVRWHWVEEPAGDETNPVPTL